MIESSLCKCWFRSRDVELQFLFVALYVFTMAQGSLKARKKKTKGAAYAKKKGPSAKRKKILGAKVTRRKRAPAKRKFHKRDKEIGKLLHKNIERLAAAKALKHEGKLSLTDLRGKAKEQLAVETGIANKKKRTRDTS